MYDENSTRPRLVETQRELRGHDFLPSDAELAEIPGVYATEDTPGPLKKIRLHYFTAVADWWLTEVWLEDAGDDVDPPLWMAFGYVRFASIPDGAEWGYVSLNELEQLKVTHRPTDDPILTVLTDVGLVVPKVIIVERDLSWEPRLAHEVIPGIPAPNATDEEGAIDD
jgi:hypothetical protein